MIEHDIWLTICKMPSSTKLELMLSHGSSEKIWSNLNNNKNFNDTEKKYLLNSWDNEKIEEIKQILLKKNIHITSYNDEDYPKRLRLLKDAPSLLYYMGDIKKLNYAYSVSIVGSRKCTPYGLNASSLIVKELCSYGISIISGLARGIDTNAHMISLQSGGYTCAVLGCGIDVVYPRENQALYNSLSQKGCIISEFIPGTEPYSYNFPIRNRIISALSDVIIVIEASNKSGSLITANLALDQGKDVMALPGSIFSDQSKGCNKLIKEGAYPLTCIEDILELLNIEPRKFNDEKDIELSGKERKIIDALNDSPIHTDDLLKICNIDIKQLYEVLFELQLKKQIMCLAGNYYVRINQKI